MKITCLEIILLFYCSTGIEAERKDLQEEFLGNPDDRAEIERPCAVFNLHCIRRYFAIHSHCWETNGPIPDPLYRSQMEIYFGRVNLTVTLTDVNVSSLGNASVEEFYVNNATNKLVIAVEFRNLSYTTPASYFRFQRKAREPIVAVAPAAINFGPVTFTGVFPNVKNLQIEDIEVTAFAQNSVPAFIIGPQVAENPDPAVTQTLAEFLDDLPTDVQEDLYNEGIFYLPAYIQYNICDFGIKIL